ncbi:MAG: hypothetical protein KDC85_12955 [Saprospiraceae bacterium]|nr:hypothetical protein [Saprospiraceae bacterium]MCB9324002.1 hypothetical protein [Lewinellaceae bacterium]
MKNYRFKLEKSSKKHICPQCGKRRYVKFVNTKTKEYLPGKYGRCDRESNCGYFLTPYADDYLQLSDENTDYKSNKVNTNSPKTPPPPVFIPENILLKTLEPERYQQNVFIQNLLKRIPFPIESTEVEKVIALYFLGTVNQGYMSGSTTYPFIDKKGKIRAIQVKQFDNENHTLKTSFLHSIILNHYRKTKQNAPGWLNKYQNQDKKVSCLFGEHLLSLFPENPIGLVEAPKTAIYGTLYFGMPDRPENFLWLAVYNLSSLNYEKCKALYGRDVFLFPDLSKDGSAYKLWSEKAVKLEDWIPKTTFTVSDLLERNASKADRHNGLDLADYLEKQDWRTYRTFYAENKNAPPGAGKQPKRGII